MDKIRKCNLECEHHSRLSEHTSQCSYKFDVIVRTNMPCRYNLPPKESPLAEKAQSFQEADRRDNPVDEYDNEADEERRRRPKGNY